MAIQTKVAAVSSVALRAGSYFFLRWPMATAVFTLFAIYIPTFVSTYFSSLADDLVYEETEVLVKDTVINGDSNGNAVEDEDVVVEEVEVNETLVVGEPPISSWYSLVTGLPNPRSMALSLVTLLINVACVTMVADRVYHERYITADDLSFIRVGYVSDTEAKLLVREPDQSKMPVTVEVQLKDAEPPFESTLWQKVGSVRWTDNTTDYTAVITVPAAHRDQRTYLWRSSNNHTGEFTSAPRVGQYPNKHNGTFTFLSTSCIVNRLPYNPLDHPLSIPGMRHLAKLIPDLGAQFMLFLGDFVYADVPKFWGGGAGDYRQKYRAVYASPEWPQVGQNLSWIHVLDDHEIKNDWDNNQTGLYEAAVDPWHHYHTSVNPPAVKSAGLGTTRGGITWYEFTQGPASFFMLDTRSYRSNNVIPYTDDQKTMLGPNQLNDLLAYLRRPEPRGVQWKIIASSVPFTKNWPVNRQDTWGGFLVERQKILEAMWDAAASGYGVVVLSGDRHEFAATKFPPPTNSTWEDAATVYEFSASPLSQFYSPIPTYKQTDNQDVKIKYINSGYSKFGAISIGKDPNNSARSSLSYRLFVDGTEAWNTTILSPNVGKTAGGLWERLVGAI
ncbi:hypothetical protein N0V93_006893 [Gnomoniopsis smithogilvyi]|uniref:PhoD-like phosphatase metallophosphatase domain-containing protein n=1 Tax=Gnomoniopsis smithogilvyi TaxID=1191159 RepID=A0A9W8YPG7_9PEZI|nr:hypothetical protein N0V93_006893 [Gnomoniopsis smithogilvyi]